MTPGPIGTEERLGITQMMTSALEGKHPADQFIMEGNTVVVRGHWSASSREV